MSVGIKQKNNVDIIARKVLQSVILPFVYFSSNFSGFSFFQRILQLCYSTMMGMSMGGMNSGGVIR